MHDKKPPIQDGASLAALKTAIMVEQRVLELDPHIARARTDALLDETLCEASDASAPLVVSSMQYELL